jgi:predicted RNA-binding Zn-ribbon protein involved in translation (DUF1610 family)
MDREKVIREIEDALSDDLAKSGYIYGLSLDGLKDKALTDVLVRLKKPEATLYKCPNCGTWVSAKNVVRCKDCQFMYISECDPNKEMWCCAKHHILATVRPDFFCADGVMYE